MADDKEKFNIKDLIRAEYSKCSVDPNYFIDRHCQIQHPTRGRLPFKMYQYQKDLIQTFEREQYTIVLKGRQIGISTAVACYALWMMLFKRDTKILVIATKRDTAKNIITKVRVAFESLPNYLKMPCEEKNKLSMRFINGSEIVAESSNSDSARSHAASICIIDEAAFIANGKELWTSAQGTLAQGGKGILLSTPSGMDPFFYAKYVEAEESRGQQKDGAFFPVKLDWSVHPERDEDWKNKEMHRLGPQGFRQEHCAEFIGSGNTFIDGDIIEFIRATYVRDPILKYGPGGDVWVWEQPDYTKSYLISADVSRGMTSDVGDYSAFHVFDIETMTQVAEYKGKIDTNEYGNLLVWMGNQYNQALMVVENGGIGWSALQKVIDLNYPNIFYTTQDLKYLDGMNGFTNKYYARQKNAVAGFTTSQRTRPLILSKMDEAFRESYPLPNSNAIPSPAITIRSIRTINELHQFIWHNGKPQAAEGQHDDLVIPMAISLWVRDTALQLQTHDKAYTRLALDKMHKTGAYDAVYVAPSQQVNPYKFPMPGGGEFDMRELL